MAEDNKITRATEWLNDKLYPILGPPPLGPYEDDRAERPWHEYGDDACPICGRPMRSHDVIEDPEDDEVWLRCPGAPAGQQLESARDA